MDFDKSYLTQDKVAVEFKGISNAYLVDSPLNVHYAFNGGYEPNANDWVGIFKMGWKTQKEFVTYKYLSQSVVNQNCDSFLTFQKQDLPEDDGCSYQFCYISSTNGLLGTTNSFEFKNDLVEDLVELETSGESFVGTKNCSIYKTSEECFPVQEKYAQLEGQLKDCEDKILGSTKKISQLETEIEILKDCETYVKRQLTHEKEKVENLLSDISLLENKNQLAKKALIKYSSEIENSDFAISIGKSCINKKYAKTRTALCDLEKEKSKNTPISDLLKSEKEYVGQLRGEIGKLEMDLENKVIVANDLRDELQLTEKGITEVENRINKKLSYSAEIREVLQSASSKNENLLKDIKEAKLKVAKYEKYTATVSSRHNILKEDLSNGQKTLLLKKEELAVATCESNDLAFNQKVEYQRLRTLKNDLKKEKNRSLELTVELKENHSEFETLELVLIRKKEDLCAFTNDLTQYYTDMENVINNNKDLLKKISSENKKEKIETSANVNSVMASMSEKLVQLNKQLAKCDQKSNALLATVTSMEKNLKDLKSENKYLRELLVANDAEASQLLLELNDTKASNDSLNVILSESAMEESKLKANIRKLEWSLKDLKKDHELTLKATNDEIVKQEMLTNRLGLTKMEADKTQSEIINATEQSNQITWETSKEKINCSILLGKINKAKVEINNHEKRLAELKLVHSGLKLKSNNCPEVQLIFERLDEEIENLKKTLESHKKCRAEKIIQLREAVDRTKDLEKELLEASKQEKEYGLASQNLEKEKNETNNLEEILNARKVRILELQEQIKSNEQEFVKFQNNSKIARYTSFEDFKICREKEKSEVTEKLNSALKALEIVNKKLFAHRESAIHY